MISKASYFVAGVIAAALAVVPAEASTITVLIGNASPPFANGATTTSAIAQAAQNGTGVFAVNTVCGTDTALNNNCSASWTFNYVVPAGETVTAGSLTLGLVDIDSIAAGDQVNNYSVAGGDNLTGLLNAAANLVLSVNNQYDVFTLPLTSFAVFNSGSATVNFALQPPGKGVLPAGTVSNGAFLMFSRLDLTTAANGGTTNPVPDPASTALLLATSFGILATTRAKKRAR
jgi:hypothetical protein